MSFHRFGSSTAQALITQLRFSDDELAEDHARILVRMNAFSLRVADPLSAPKSTNGRASSVGYEEGRPRCTRSIAGMGHLWEGSPRSP
jgi:hypothetical protein